MSLALKVDRLGVSEGVEQEDEEEPHLHHSVMTEEWDKRRSWARFYWRGSPAKNTEAAGDAFLDKSPVKKEKVTKHAHKKEKQTYETLKKIEAKV